MIVFSTLGFQDETERFALHTYIDRRIGFQERDLIERAADTLNFIGAVGLPQLIIDATLQCFLVKQIVGHYKGVEENEISC